MTQHLCYLVHYKFIKMVEKFMDEWKKRKIPEWMDGIENGRTDGRME